MPSDDKIIVYGRGLACRSVCAPAEATRDEIEAFVNAEDPTGIDSPWAVSAAAKFADGLDNPRVCEQDPARKHWLLVC